MSSTGDRRARPCSRYIEAPQNCLTQVELHIEPSPVQPQAASKDRCCPALSPACVSLPSSLYQTKLCEVPVWGSSVGWFSVKLCFAWNGKWDVHSNSNQNHLTQEAWPPDRSKLLNQLFGQVPTITPYMLNQTVVFFTLYSLKNCEE